jgi:O-antigen/teichoic acid export membrane protein
MFVVNNLKNAVIISYVGILVSILSGLFYTPWMIDELGVSDYGLYSLALAVVSFLSIDFGLSAAVTKYLSEYKAKGDLESIQAFLNTVCRLFLIISIIILLFLSISYFSIEGVFIKLGPEEIERLKVVYIIAGVFSVMSFGFKPFEGILISHEKFVFIKSIDLLTKIVTLISVVVLLMNGNGLYELVFASAFLNFIKNFSHWIYMSNKLNYKINLLDFERRFVKQILTFTGWVTVGFLSQRLILVLSPMILAALNGSAEVAIFSLAMVLEGYLWLFSSAIGGLFLPRVSNIVNLSKDSREIGRLMIKVGRMQHLIVAFFLLGLVLLGHEFILLWVGEKFEDSFYVLLMLTAHSIITLPQEIAQTTLVVKGKVKYRAFASMITVIISLPLSLFFATKYGAIGIAFSILIGNLIGSLLFMNFIYLTKLKLDLKHFFRCCHGKLIVPVIGTFIAMTFISNFLEVGTIVIFLLKAFLMLIIYVVLNWIFSLNDWEKELFANLFKKIFKRKIYVQR